MDWMFLLLLGIAMALLSFLLDYLIEKAGEGELKLLICVIILCHIYEMIWVYLFMWFSLSDFVYVCIWGRSCSKSLDVESTKFLLAVSAKNIFLNFEVLLLHHPLIDKDQGVFYLFKNFRKICEKVFTSKKEWYCMGFSMQTRDFWINGSTQGLVFQLHVVSTCCLSR